MPRAGFEPLIPVFERTKTVHALDRVSTVSGRVVTTKLRYLFCISGDEYIKSIDFICILLAS
jgi:hypothetical protein